MKLVVGTLVKFIMGVALVGAMLFLPAWTMYYPGAWLFLGVLFVPMLIMGAVMLCISPALVQKRLSGKEKESAREALWRCRD